MDLQDLLRQESVKLNDFSNAERTFAKLSAFLKSEDKKPPKGFEKFFKKKEEREKETSSATKGKAWEYSH